MMVIGVIVTGGCILVAVWGQSPLHYSVALILLGIGWNFLYTAGSTLITTTYRSSERFKAQGANDFIVFGTMAVVSLAAGVLLEHAGWKTLVLSTVPLLVLMLALLVIASRRRSRNEAGLADSAASLKAE